MALAENLPVFKATYELLRKSYNVCLKLERAYRFTLGQRIQNEITDILLNIYRANTVYEKMPHIRTAREKTMLVRLLIRVAFDEKQISTKQFLGINETIESISKQLNAWEKSGEKKIKN